MTTQQDNALPADDRGPANSPPLAEDMLRGADAIAAYIGESPRRVFYLAERKLIPVFKIGNLLRARKSALRQHIAEREAEAMSNERPT